MRYCLSKCLHAGNSRDGTPDFNSVRVREWAVILVMTSRIYNFNVSNLSWEAWVRSHAKNVIKFKLLFGLPPHISLFAANRLHSRLMYQPVYMLPFSLFSVKHFDRVKHYSFGDGLICRHNTERTDHGQPFRATLSHWYILEENARYILQLVEPVATSVV